VDWILRADAGACVT